MKIFGLFKCLPFEKFTVERIHQLTLKDKAEIKTICDKLRESDDISGKRIMRLSSKHTNKTHLKLPKK